MGDEKDAARALTSPAVESGTFLALVGVTAVTVGVGLLLLLSLACDTVE
jgi:hypothetical protein